ncbi:MAG: DUF166 family protein [Bacillota bacterium]
MAVRILVAVHGIYGRRICEHIQKQGPADWQVAEIPLPRVNLPVIDEPEKYLPPAVTRADLLLHLGESHQAAQLVPALAQAAGAHAVIAPVDHSHWIPPGLRNQLRKELAQDDRVIVFPEPFCSLTVDRAGLFPPMPYDHPLISDFARHFGSPRLEVDLSDDGQYIVAVHVVRGSPCGSSHYAAARMAGLMVDDAIPKAGLICLHYPCLASMALEDRAGRIETLMHLAGQVFNGAVERALARGQ